MRAALLCLTWVTVLQAAAATMGEDTSAQTSSPVVINTWGFQSATRAAWRVLSSSGSGSGSALDAVELGCTQCERDQCDGTVGFGGSPDENGETTLEAMIMDGTTSNVGAVASMRRIKSAISVARRVLENTHHSMLAGELATEFAVQMGFTEETLSTDKSTEMWRKWKEEDSCQPNFWTNVTPNPSTSCGPYTSRGRHQPKPEFGKSGNHDTIGMIALDKNGQMAAGTSTNGANHKIPGRVGDSPIPGSGAYVDTDVGGASATGDGDVMLRFLPSFLAVEAMRQGLAPQMAAQTAIDRITARHPDFSGAVVALRRDGRYGAACHNIDVFPYSVASEELGGIKVFNIKCSGGKEM